MEESRMRVKLGRVSFSKHTRQSHYMKERMDTIGENGAMEMYNENSELSVYHTPLQISSSPDQQAMEFLSRTWSPSSSDFFQILSSNNLVPKLEHRAHEDKKEELEEETENNKISINRDTTISIDQIFTLLSSGKLAQLVPQKRHSLSATWITVGQMKAWLGGNVLTNLTRGGRKRRKEELRLHAAQVDAALSVTRLAAAIAGIVANSNLQPVNSKGMSMNYDLVESMNTIVSSAAALVATVCAEAAESIGASREHVASVISTGLSTQTSQDMVTLTATAATCLRGAATLELRAAARRHISEDQKILARDTRLPVRTPEGRTQVRIVSIYRKNDKLALKLGKKHMGGVISTYKEYRIFDVMENSKEGVFSKDEQGFYLLTLSTTGGTIQVLFEDPKLYRIWNSTLSHLLCD